MDARGHGRHHGDRHRARADRRGPPGVGHLVGRPSRRATATRGPRSARATEGAGRASRCAPIRDGRDPLRVGVGGRDGHRLAAATGRTGDAASPRRRSQRPRRPGGGHGPATGPRGGCAVASAGGPRPDRDTGADPEDVRGHRHRRVDGDDLDAARPVDRGDHLGGRGHLGLGCGTRADGADRVSDRRGVGCRRPVGPVRRGCSRRRPRRRPVRTLRVPLRRRTGAIAVDDGNRRTSTQDTPHAGRPDAAGLVLGRSDTGRTVRAVDADLRAVADRGAGRGIDGGRAAPHADPAPRQGRRRPRHWNERGDAIPPTIPTDDVPDHPGRDSQNSEERRERPISENLRPLTPVTTVPAPAAPSR